MTGTKHPDEPLMEKTLRELYEFYSPADKQDFFIAYLYLKHTERFVKNTLSFLGMPTATDVAPPDRTLDDLFRNYVRQIAENAPDPRTNIYHGKVLPHDLARKIVTLNRGIRIEVPERVVPFAIARDVILENVGAISVGRCPCRAAQPNPCVPPAEQELCLIMGDPFASFIAAHNPSFRHCTRDEAVAILEKAHRNGNVHTAYFKKEMGRRLMALCNCCSCCCMGMIMWNKLGGAIPFLAASGFLAAIGEECTGCGACTDGVCPFNALSADGEGAPVVDAKKCMGCGVCVDKCPAGAIALRRDESKGVPLDIDALA